MLGLVTTRGALSLVLGGALWVSVLVVVMTFDIKVVAPCAWSSTPLLVVSSPDRPGPCLCFPLCGE